MKGRTARKLKRSELLRGLPGTLQKSADRFQSTANGRGLRMQARDRQCRLVAMRGVSGDAVQQQGTARRSLRVPVGNREPREQRPPVVDQRNRAGQNLAASQVMGGEAGPAH